jgi:hypothetical protein
VDENSLVLNVNKDVPPEALTCDAEAMYIPGSPMFGAQATSLTQSSCPRMTSSSIHFFASSSYAQILTTLSDPADTNRFCVVRFACDVAGCLAALAAGVERTEGAHEMAFAPVPCAGKTDASVEPSSALSARADSRLAGAHFES